MEAKLLAKLIYNKMPGIMWMGVTCEMTILCDLLLECYRAKLEKKY